MLREAAGSRYCCVLALANSTAILSLAICLRGPIGAMVVGQGDGGWASGFRCFVWKVARRLHSSTCMHVALADDTSATVMDQK